MMTKAVLIRSISQTTGLSVRVVSECIDGIFDIIRESIARRERIELRGFGTFEVKEVSAKKYPSSFSAQTMIPAHGKIVFRPCQKLKEAVWNKL